MKNIFKYKIKLEMKDGKGRDDIVDDVFCGLDIVLIELADEYWNWEVYCNKYSITDIKEIAYYDLRAGVWSFEWDIDNYCWKPAEPKKEDGEVKMGVDMGKDAGDSVAAFLNSDGVIFPFRDRIKEKQVAEMFNNSFSRDYGLLDAAKKYVGKWKEEAIPDTNNGEAVKIIEQLIDCVKHLQMSRREALDEKRELEKELETGDHIIDFLIKKINDKEEEC